jgi:toxin ParE1/3/4
MAHVNWTSQARADVAEIADYIAERSQSIGPAERMVDRIHRACDKLAQNPGMGQARPEFATGQLRSWTVGNYVIYYRPSSEGIVVMRVLYGARDHEALL